MNLKSSQVSNGGHSEQLSAVFEQLPELKSLIDVGRLTPLSLTKGQIIYRPGEPGASFFLLLSGMLGMGVTLEESNRSFVEKLSPGTIVGELSILTGRPRSATLYALTDGEVIEISRELFDELAGEDPDIVRRVASAASPRWRRIQLVKVLHEIFGPLEPESMAELQNVLEWTRLSSGNVLLRQGDEGDGLYIVVHGRLQIEIANSEGQESIIGEVGAGQTVGEFSLITGMARTATVRAIRESHVVKLTKTDFEKLVHQFPGVMWPITRIIVERQQRRQRGAIRDNMAAQCFTLIPTSAGLDVERFALQLADCLCKFGPTMLLDSRRFEELFGQPGSAQSGATDALNVAIAAWLNEQEVIHDHILFVADNVWTPWTERCVSQSDMALLIADPDRDPTLSPVEISMQALPCPIRSDLVLIHPGDREAPSGTSLWLEPRQVRRHYHVRQEENDHMERLARGLTGRSIGLALSGGGARGFVHLGVYRALLELDIPVDYIGGTSMGALAGGLMVSNKSYQELMELSGQFANPKSLFDYTLPYTSLMASRKVTAILKRLFAQRRIEDSWLPYFCVSTNLTRAEPVVHQRGEMWRAIRSSVSIPGIFAPFMDDGELLVDGGPINNFPVDLMIELSESRRVIGVQASQHKVKKIAYDLDGGVSGWRILAGRILPFLSRKRAPSIAGTILRTMEVNSVHQARHRASLADLLIQPSAKRFSFLDFAAYEPIAREGYEASLEPLRQWKERQEL